MHRGVLLGKEDAALTHEIYRSLELDPDRLGKLLANGDEPDLGALLDLLAGPPHISGTDAEDIEAFLMQRQSHVLGRADRPCHA